MKIVVAAIMLVAAFLAGGIESASAQRCPRGDCATRPNRPTPTRPPVTRPDRPNRPTPPVVDRPSRPTRPVEPTRPTRPVEPTRPNRPTPPVVDRPTRPTRPVEPTRPTRPIEPTRPNRPTPPVVDRPTRPNRPDYDRPHTRPTTRPPTNYRRPRPTYTSRDQLRQIHRDYHRVYSFRAHYYDPYRPYVYYHHNPYYGSIHHSVRYYNPYDYYSRIPYRYVYWDSWVRWGVSYNDGFFYIESYPYFVYNGYRHRYSPVDTCDYELVDGYDNRAVATFHGRSCQSGYDMCANERDERNYRSYDHRYFCAERLDNSRSYNWNYNDDFYSDLDYYDPYYY